MVFSELFSGLRVEYARALARAARWREEEQLVKEEMRRVLVFLMWRANDWMSRAHAYSARVGSRCQVGSIAYANRQASVLQGMAQYFSQLWRGNVGDYELPQFENIKLVMLIEDIRLPTFVC